MLQEDESPSEDLILLENYLPWGWREKLNISGNFNLKEYEMSRNN